MKAVLVIDMPSSCDECLCCYEGYCVRLERGMGMWAAHTGKPVDCPIRPLPDYDWHEEGKENECEQWYRNGWNACLDTITGEKDGL